MTVSNKTWRFSLFAAAAGCAVSALAQSSIQPFSDIDISGPAKRFVPRSVDATPATVVVIMAGDSVAAVQKSAGRQLTRVEKDGVIAARKSEQSSVKPDIEARGGEVIGEFQSAMHGLKVRIPKNRVSTLLSIPGVISVKHVGVYLPTNVVSVPSIGAPQVWESRTHNRGQGVKVAIIDTGIDYTHANFGGPGTVAAFNAAFAKSTTAADPAFFGPHAPKVKGGIDLVGDKYDASSTDPAHYTPVPDPNPLDCNGHGSHTAGTAAGFGVNAFGTTYTGQYSAAAYTPGAFKIGPGVAPMAELYAIRVFGCSGSTSVVSEAIDWAVDHDVDVISMSLGSSWGTADNAESEAIKNATAAGILVVASAGNSGPTPYIGGSPAAADGVISVAAMDATASFPGASLKLTGTPAPIVVQNSNAGAFVNNTAWPIVVLRNSNGTVSLGCDPAEYVDSKIAGKLVVTQRGSCARVLRVQYGFQHGAAAVAMINSGAGYPVFEGAIPALSGPGNVTIPFFGVLQSDAAALSGPPGGPAKTAVATAVVVPNPTFDTVASFSSGGPRYGDSVLKPNLTAPGVSISSTASGTGFGSVVESGTSMAAPHVAGVAALVKEAHPKWSLDDLRAAVVQTASPSALKDYSPRIEGAGQLRAVPAAQTEAVAISENQSLSFGFADLLQDFSATQQLKVHTNGHKPITFRVSVTKVVGNPTVTVTAPSAVTVGPKTEASIPITLNVPAFAVGGTHNADGTCCLFQEIGGYVTLRPVEGGNNGASLTIPYYLVAHARSNLSTNTNSISSSMATVVDLSNVGGQLPATPDFYALGLSSSMPQGVTYADTRAVGVKAVTSGSGGSANPLLVFAINTFDRFSNAAPNEWDILIDTTGTGNPNFALVGANGSSFTTSPIAQNTLVAALINLTTNKIVSLRFADVATDNSTILLPVNASALGLTSATPTFTYSESHFSLNGASGALPGPAKFNAFAPALTVNYSNAPVYPDRSATATVNINPAQWALTPAQGLMIVAPDNRAGPSQARLIFAYP